MTALIRKDSRVAEMLDWLEGPWTARRPASSPMRVEDYLRDGTYLVRAELPGLDPEHDIDVTVSRGVLTIHAERHDEPAGRQHSEFRYGTFSRSVTLPPGADEQQIDAVYSHGILEVAVHLADQSARPAARTIPVQQDQHIKPS